jgi:hypothetical protein
MALVRRSAIIGQLDRVLEKGAGDLSGAIAAQVKAAANGNGAATGTATRPADGAAAGGATAGDDAAVSLSSAPAWAANAEAAAVASKGASITSILGAFVLVAIGTGVAYTLIRWGRWNNPFEIGNQVSAYAALIVFAGAVERVLEPFSNLLPGTRARARYESAVAALANAHPAASLHEVATAKAKLDQALANRTVLMWGLATAVAAVVSAAGGFYILHMIAAKDWSDHIPTWVDALVTGLVVGTGTKPLHDLISRAQGAGRWPRPGPHRPVRARTRPGGAGGAGRAGSGPERAGSGHTDGPTAGWRRTGRLL